MQPDAVGTVSDQELRSAFEWDAPADGRTTAGVAARHRRLRRLPPALVAVAACALAAGALAGVLSLTGGSSVGQAVLLDAARGTSQAGGYRFGMTTQVTVNGRNVELIGGGEVNEHPLTGAVTLNVEGVTVSERVLPPYVYVQDPDTGGLWQRATIPPLPTSSMTGLDPQQMLDELRSAASITDAGQQTVDGVQTTHYHCTIDVARLIAADPALRANADVAALAKLGGDAGEMPIDVWIDGQNRVRELSESLSMQVAGQTASVSLAMQLYDYGAQPSVSAPPADEVQDVGSPPSLAS